MYTNCSLERRLSLLAISLASLWGRQKCFRIKPLQCVEVKGDKVGNVRSRDVFALPTIWWTWARCVVTGGQRVSIRAQVKSGLADLLAGWLAGLTYLCAGGHCWIYGHVWHGTFPLSLWRPPQICLFMSTRLWASLNCFMLRALCFVLRALCFSLTQLPFCTFAFLWISFRFPYRQRSMS